MGKSCEENKLSILSLAVCSSQKSRVPVKSLVIDTQIEYPWSTKDYEIPQSNKKPYHVFQAVMLNFLRMQRALVVKAQQPSLRNAYFVIRSIFLLQYQKYALFMYKLILVGDSSYLNAEGEEEFKTLFASLNVVIKLAKYALIQIFPNM